MTVPDRMQFTNFRNVRLSTDARPHTGKSSGATQHAEPYVRGILRLNGHLVQGRALPPTAEVI